MPMPSPLDALRTLQRGPATANDPMRLAALRDARLSEMGHNLDMAEASPQVSYLGPNQGLHNAALFGTGATRGDQRDLQADINTDPGTGVAAQAQSKAINTANLEAMLSGFTGNKDIGVHKLPGGRVDQAISVPPPGGGEYPAPMQQAAHASAAMAAQKINEPLLTQLAKNQGAQDLAGQEFTRMMSLANGGATSGATPAGPSTPTGAQPPSASPSTQPAPQPGHPSLQPSPLSPASPSSPAPPPQSQSWGDFIKGGKGDYNSLGDLLSAAGERAKYSVMATPQSRAIQAGSFANLQQLAGQFPGVRGFGLLLPMMEEHQGRYGHETYASTYNRAVGMRDIMDRTEKEMDDPSLRLKLGADGKIQMSAIPATILRGKLALKDARVNLEHQIQEMEQQHPGIGSHLASQWAEPSSQAPASPNQPDPYSNPNYTPR